jgi:SAM-dependent methyltransferase
MEAAVRKPFQGVTNIIRFNWHFYAMALLFTIILFTSTNFLPIYLYWTIISIGYIICLTTLFSLLVSYYIYDYSGLYNLQWLKEFGIDNNAIMVTFTSGFDETSATLAENFPHAHISVFDFYNPYNHPEISIKRARNAYATYPGTQQISTAHIPVEKSTVDFTVNIFSVHEIRDRQERIAFLKNQYEILKKGGSCLVVEHLRDVPNFLAYTIGFFHFLPLREWRSNFMLAGFIVKKIKKITPFVSIFILQKSHGDTP